MKSFKISALGFFCLFALSSVNAGVLGGSRVARSPGGDDVEGIIPSTDPKKTAPAEEAAAEPSASDQGNHDHQGEVLLKTLNKALARLRASPVADDGLKTDIDEFQDAIKSGNLNSTLDAVRKDVLGGEGRPSISKILDSFSERAPEGFRGMITRIEKAARDALQRLLSSGSKARTHVEDTLRSVFSTAVDAVTN